MFTYIELEVVLMLLPICWASDELECFGGQVLIDGACYSACLNVTGGRACNCFGDICYHHSWCRDDQTCCRTCENNWHLLYYILGGIASCVVLAVLHGELCTKPEPIAEFEIDDKLVVVRQHEPQSELPEVVRIGKEQTSSSQTLEMNKIPQSKNLDLDRISKSPHGTLYEGF